MPCTKSWVKRSSMLMPAISPSLAAVSMEMTTSPRSCGAMLLNCPVRMGNAITFVWPHRLKYFLLSTSILGSSTIRMESSASGQAKAFKMSLAVCCIFSRDILYLFCLLSNRTSIFFLSVVREMFFWIFNSVMVYS